MGRLYRRSLQGGDRVKTRRIWRLLDLDRTNIVNMQITKWNKFDTSQSRETQVCSIYWRFWDLDCAGSRWKSCRGVMLRRGNQGGQLLLGNCVEHLEARWFYLIGKGQRWDKTFKKAMSDTLMGVLLVDKTLPDDTIRMNLGCCWSWLFGIVWNLKTKKLYPSPTFLGLYRSLGEICIN